MYVYYGVEFCKEKKILWKDNFMVYERLYIDLYVYRDFIFIWGSLE